MRRTSRRSIFGGSILNGGDGWHAHPSQALLDLYTIRGRLPGGPDLHGRKVVIVGDILHSRVARSNLWSLTAAGADLWLCGPSTLLRGFERWAAAIGEAPGHGRFTVTSDVDAALRDADVVMALRIQRERMSGGLLPSLREYAARYGLTRERLARARPDVLVMHPGPMNEGVEIAPDVAVDPRSVITDQVTNGVAVRMALLYLLAGATGAGHAARGRRWLRPARSRRASEVGRRIADLEISRAWLVDPAAGREGPGELVVEDGIVRSVVWLEAPEADGVDARGVVVAPGFVDLHAHFREPGFEDAETVASGAAAAAHGGFTTVCLMPNTMPAVDEASVLGRVLEAAAPVRLAGRDRWPTAPSARAGRARRWPRSGELADAGAIGFSDDGAPVRSPAILRNALLYAGSLGRPVVDHAEDPALTDGAEANEGLVATVLGLRGWPVAAEVAAVARDLAVLAEAVRDEPGARLHLTHLSTAAAIELVRRAKASRPAGDLRRHAPSPRPHRRVAGRRSSLGVGGARRRRPGAQPVGRRRARRPAVRPVAPGQPAAALGGGRGRRASRRSSTGRRTRSPRITRRTPRVDKEVEFGLAANGISGDRDRARPGARGGRRRPAAAARAPSPR